MKNDAQNTIAFEGATLDEAYKKATTEFGCSITELKSEIIQAPTSGFLGFFKKNAIIKVFRETIIKEESIKVKRTKIEIKDVEETVEEIDLKDENNLKNISTPQIKKEKIFNDFYSDSDNTNEIEKTEIKMIKSDEILETISTKVNSLFSKLCYDIDDIKVSYYDDNTVYIQFSGEDSALLIGKEGYRYKALSYIIFNWIHDKYDLMVRLEVAEFLKHQEEAMNSYLEPVIQAVKEEGKYKTKPLDGILVHIALKRLRDEFPDKYVAVKNTRDGNKYILITEYRNF